MKKLLTTFVVLICLFTALNFFWTNNSEAKIKSNTEVTSQEIFIYITVQEGDRTYIYIYTESGIYVTKIEEL